MSLFVKLDANYPDNPKVIAAGLDGAGVHAFALCIAKRQESDGWIARVLLRRCGATDDLIERLIDLRLLDTDGDLIRPHGWHERNPSQGAIDATRASKAESAKAGNHRRWNHDGEMADCLRCNPEPQVIAARDRNGSQDESGCDRKRSPVGSPESESESEVEPEEKSDSDAATERSGDEIEQRSRRALALHAEAVALRQGATNPSAYAAKVAKSASEDGTLDRLRSLVASGKSAEQAVAALDQRTVTPAGDPAEVERVRLAAHEREAETALRRAEITAPGGADHAAGLALARSIRKPVAS